MSLRGMERLLIILFAALTANFTTVHAQEVVVPVVQEEEGRTYQEQQALVTALEATYATLTEQLDEVTQLAGTVDRIAAKRFVEIQGEIRAEMTRVESVLDRMRGTDHLQWPALKAEYERLNDALKAGVDARARGLREAYGEE